MGGLMWLRRERLVRLVTGLLFITGVVVVAALTVGAAWLLGGRPF